MAGKPGHPQSLLKYGWPFPADADPLQIEFAAIRALTELPSKGVWQYRGRLCGNGLAYHVRAAMKLIWPDLMWHRWNDLIVDAIGRGPGRTAIFGAASSGKSLTVSRLGLTLFYARPHGTTVLISSTTRDALQRRVWDYIVSSDKAARARYDWLEGSLIESKIMLLADDSDADNRSMKNGVLGVAAKVGGQWKGMEAFIGTKNEVMVVIADEMQFMPPGILDAVGNLESNEMCFSTFLGNMPNIQNPLADAAEPKNGWSSLRYSNKSRMYETKWSDGRAVQLIALDSPNLDYPEGQEPYAGLIGRKYIAQQEQQYGRGTPKFAMFADGNIPTADMTMNCLSKDLCIRNGATQNVIWGHQKIVRGYGMDAAYSGVGGDRTIGAPFAFGIDSENKWRFWMGPLKVYAGSMDSNKTHAEAIAEEAQQECKELGIDPEHFFFDGTGRSELTSALGRIWSPAVVPIEFGGMATERVAFTGEKHMDGEDAGERKNCREVFDRFVTELWFALKFCVEYQQMRGLSLDVIEEGSRRMWELVRGNKYSVETKKDMKDRGLRSPDAADCAVCCLEGARRLGFPLGNLSPNNKRSKGWIDSLRKQEWDSLKAEQLEAA